MKIATIVLGFLVLMGASVLAEPTPINASQAREEFTAVGQMPTIAGSPMVGPGAAADLTISVDSYSTDDEARAMVAAFNRGQHKALRSALEKASVKARIAFVGRNGFYELKLLRSKKTLNGRQIFGVGEKSIRFLDAYYSGRWHLEEFGILQLELTNNNGVEEGSGTMIHKAQIKSFTPDSITLDDQGIEPVRLAVRKQ